MSGKDEYKKVLLKETKNFDIVNKTSSKTFDIVASMLEDGSDVIIDVDELVKKNYRTELMKEVRRRLNRSEVAVYYVVFVVERRRYWEKAKGNKSMLNDINKCLSSYDDIDDTDAVYFDELIYIYN